MLGCGLPCARTARGGAAATAMTTVRMTIACQIGTSHFRPSGLVRSRVLPRAQMGNLQPPVRFAQCRPMVKQRDGPQLVEGRAARAALR